MTEEEKEEDLGPLRGSSSPLAALWTGEGYTWLS